MRSTIVSALALLLVFAPLAAAESTAAAGPRVHVIAKGETIYSIARAFKVTPEALLKANGISDPTRLMVGQKLSIPQVHVVVKGETLYSIAREAGLTVDELRAANGLGANAVITPGQTLVLLGKPAGSASTAGSAGAAATGGAQGPSAKTGATGSATTSTPGSGPKGSTPGSADSSSTLFPPLVKTSAKAVDGKLAWPCKGEARYLDGKIDGIMFLTERGMPSLAVASGKVVSAGPYRGFGLVVFVQSKSGYYYVYAGNDSLSVRMGDQVKAGQELGKVGFDAKEGRAAAYFFVFRDGQSLDPAKAPRG